MSYRGAFMYLKKALVLTVVMAMSMSLISPATAGGKKKKGPKPYKSEEGVIVAPHTMLYSSTGEVNSITVNEFEARCAIPASNGLDAYVYEVPKEYQKIEANAEAHGMAQVAWDLYIFFYKKDCTPQPTAASAQGTVTQADIEGIMPAGTAWVVIADFAGDPVTVFYELSPRKG
jgi:hypothetical protein